MTAGAFWLLALLAVASGFMVFRFNSMARATMSLAVSFVAVGAILLLLELDYGGLVTVVMMLMEMAIMVVFMIMYMMAPSGAMPMAMYHGKAKAMTAAIATFVFLAGGALLVDWPERQGAIPTDPTRQLGLGVMESKMLVMMGVSAVILVTIVASLVLGGAHNRYDEAADAHGSGATR